MGSPMTRSFYVARHFMIALRIAAGAELEGPLDLLVEWPARLPAPSA